MMMGEGFKEGRKTRPKFEQGQLLAEFSLVKMKRQLSSIYAPSPYSIVTKLKAYKLTIFQVVAAQDTIMTVYI